MSKLNKRAVAMFSLCLILFVTIMPFAVSADNIYLSIRFHSSEPSVEQFRYLIDVYENNTFTRYEYSSWFSTTTSGTYKHITFNDNRIYKIEVQRLRSGSIRYGHLGSSSNYEYYNVNTSLSNPFIFDNITTIYASNYNESTPLNSYFQMAQSGYTLTFDSQGGSSISSETGITDVLLADSTGYFPQYVPEYAHHEFLGWYTESDGGTQVRQLTLTEDTTLYAHWAIYDGYSVIKSINNNYSIYTDGLMTDELPSTVPMNTNITLYYNKTYNIAHNYNMWDVQFSDTQTGRGMTQTFEALNQSGTIYSLSFNTSHFDKITVQPHLFPVYECALTIEQYPDSVVSIYNGSEHLTGNSVFEFDTHSGIDLRFGLKMPNVNCDVYLYEHVEPPLIPDVPIDFTINSKVTNWNAPNDTVFQEVYVTAFPTTDCDLIIRPRGITDYDITERVPIAVVDESTGEVSWVLDMEHAWEDTISSMDYDYVRDNIPNVMNGVLDGIFSLNGLSVIVTIILVVGFSAWVLKNY